MNKLAELKKEEKQRSKEICSTEFDLLDGNSVKLVTYYKLPNNESVINITKFMLKDINIPVTKLLPLFNRKSEFSLFENLDCNIEMNSRNIKIYIFEKSPEAKK